MGMEFSLVMTWPSIFHVLLLLIIFLGLWKKFNPNTTTSKKPPGPMKLPFIGNLHQLLAPLPHRRLTDLAKIYGPFMHFQLGQISTIVVSSPQLAKQVLKDFDINFSERGRATISDILFYNGQNMVFAPYGEYWRQLRKIAVMNLLSAKRVQMHRFVREEEVSNCMSLLHSKARLPINMSDVVFSFTNSVVTRTILGTKSKRRGEIVPLIHGVLRDVGGFGVVDMFPSLEFIHVITGMKSRLLNYRKECDVVMEDIINEHKVQLKSGQSEASNLLDVLLDLQRDPDSPLTSDSVKGFILDMLCGGIDTSATVLEWAMSELMRNPKAMRKVQEEVRKAYVKYGKLDETKLHELNFLKAVVKEVMRLHPPVPLMPKECIEGCKINEYNINVKTKVIINSWAIGRDPSYWIEPEKFYPERFLEGEIDYKGSNFEFLPFGAGRRMCPGSLLGILHIELPLAKLLCHFDWELPHGMKPQDLDMTEDFGLIIRRKNDLYLIPTAY